MPGVRKGHECRVGRPAERVYQLRLGTALPLRDGQVTGTGTVRWLEGEGRYLWRMTVSRSDGPVSDVTSLT